MGQELYFKDWAIRLVIFWVFDMANRYEETDDGRLIIRQNRRVSVGHKTYDADFRCGPHKPQQDKRAKQKLEKRIREELDE